MNEKIEEWCWPNPEFKFYKFSDVLNCELIENGTSTTTTTLTSNGQKHVSLGKAIIGKALFGSVGAIVGGIAGKTTTKGRSVSIQNEYCSKLLSSSI